MSDYNLGTASGRIVVDGSGAAKGFNVAQTAGNAFFRAVRARVDDIQTLGKRMAGIGVAGTAGFGLAIKTAADFQQEMSAVQAVSGATEDKFESLRKKALQLGQDTQFSATEAASAIEELVKAGISVDDVLSGAADATVALAAAGGVSLPEAATIAANAMNQFNLAGKDVTDVADLLAGAANVSAADVSILGQSLSQVGAVANTAGLSLQDTVVALGELADAGIKGSDAGTSLKTMLLNLIPTTDRQIDKFRELKLISFDGEKALNALANKGIKPVSGSLKDVRGAVEKYLIKQKGLKKGTVALKNETQRFMVQNGVMANQFFDQEGNIKSLADIQGVLSKSLKGMSKEQKLAALETLFGTDAMRASAIMADKGREGFEEFNKEMGKTSAAEVAKTRMNNLAGAMEQLRGSLETVRIKIGTPLLKPITLIVKGITALVNWFGKLPQPVLTVIGAVGALVSIFLLFAGIGLALLPILVGMAANFAAMYIVRSLAAPVFAFGKALLFTRSAAAATEAASAAANTRWIRMVRTSKVLMASVKLLRVAFALLSFAMSPIGLAIIALVAGLIILYKKNEAFRNIVNKVAAVLKGVFITGLREAKEMLVQLWATLQDVADAVWKTLGPALKAVGGGIIRSLVEAGASLWKQIQTQLIPSFVAFWQAIQPLFPVLQQVGSVIGTVVQAVMPYILLLIGAWFKLQVVIASFVLPILIKLVGFFVNVFIASIAGVISAVIAVLTGFVKYITGWVNLIKAVLTGNWSAAWAAVKQIVGAMIGTIVGVFKGGLKPIIAALKGIVHAIENLFDIDLSAAGVKMIKSLVAGISKVKDLPGKAVKSIAGGIKGLFHGSPVKYGPLKSWNNGGAGRRLIESLAYGINAERKLATKAMEHVADAIVDPTARLNMVLGDGPDTLADALKKMDVRMDVLTAGDKVAQTPSKYTPSANIPAPADPQPVVVSLDGMRLEGELDLTSKSSATIKGMASEVDESNADFEDLMDRVK